MSKDRGTTTLEEVNMRRGVDVDLHPGAINSLPQHLPRIYPRWRWERDRCEELMNAIGASSNPEHILENAEQVGQWALELIEHLERIRGVEFDPGEEE